MTNERLATIIAAMLFLGIALESAWKRHKTFRLWVTEWTETMQTRRDAMRAKMIAQEAMRDDA